MVELACLHSPTPSTFYTRANGKSKLNKSISQMPVLFNIKHIFFQFLVCFKNLWMCSNTHKITDSLKIQKNRKHTHIHTAFCQRFNKVAPV